MGKVGGRSPGEVHAGEITRSVEAPLIDASWWARLLKVHPRGDRMRSVLKALFWLLNWPPIADNVMLLAHRYFKWVN